MSESCYEKSSKIIEKNIEGKVYIFDISKEESYILEGLSKVIWNCLFKMRIEEIIYVIQEIYDVEKDVLLKDINDFINSLTENSLIEVKNV